MSRSLPGCARRAFVSRRPHPKVRHVIRTATCAVRLAIVLGSEAHGLTQPWLDAADVRMYIPMHGQADSLNLAASAAILLYEAVRQRQPTQP